MPVFKSSDDRVAPILRRAGCQAFSSEVAVETCTTMSLSGRYWDSGSKRELIVVTADAVRRLPDENPMNPLQRDRDHQSMLMTAGVLVVEKFWFGTIKGLRIHAHPDDMPKYLSAEIVLSDAELVVLSAIRGMKSSYAGISNYRFHQANKYTGMSLATWEATKAGLIARRFLNAAGAITVDGKNAIEGRRIELYMTKIRFAA